MSVLSKPLLGDLSYAESEELNQNIDEDPYNPSKAIFRLSS